MTYQTTDLRPGARDARARVVEELTPHRLTVEQGVAARTAFDYALRTRFEEMHAEICDLPAPALTEVLYAMDILGAALRFERAGREYGAAAKRTALTLAILAPDSEVLP